MAWTREKAVLDLRDMKAFVSPKPKPKFERRGCQQKPFPSSDKRNPASVRTAKDTAATTPSPELEIRGKSVENQADRTETSPFRADVVQQEPAPGTSQRPTTTSPSDALTTQLETSPPHHAFLEEQFLSARYALAKARTEQGLLTGPLLSAQPPFLSTISLGCPDVIVAVERDPGNADEKTAATDPEAEMTGKTSSSPRAEFPSEVKSHFVTYIRRLRDSRLPRGDKAEKEMTSAKIDVRITSPEDHSDPETNLPTLRLTHRKDVTQRVEEYHCGGLK